MNLLKNWRIRKAEEDNESVYISEKFGVRSLHIGSDTIQSAMRIAHPNDLEIVYTRSMMAFLLFNPDPRKVLMVGLGGGSLAKFVYHRLPNAQTVAVEINPRVVAIARQFFYLPPDDERLQVVVGDGVTYLETARSKSDVIILDGYDAQAQVEALSTGVFYRSCARALSDSGVLVVNLWGGDRNFKGCVERIAQAFNRRVACLPAGKPGNVVALAFKRSPGMPRWNDLQHRALGLTDTMGLKFTDFVRDLAAMNPDDQDGLPI